MSRFLKKRSGDFFFKGDPNRSQQKVETSSFMSIFRFKKAPWARRDFSRFWVNGFFENYQFLTKIFLEGLQICFLVKSFATDTWVQNGGFVSSHFQNSSTVWFSLTKIGIVAGKSFLEDRGIPIRDCPVVVTSIYY